MPGQAKPEREGMVDPTQKGLSFASPKGGILWAAQTDEKKVREAARKTKKK